MLEIELTTEQAQRAGSRSALYRLLARGFAFPTVELYEEVRGGRYRAQALEAARGLAYRLEVPDPLGQGMNGPCEDFQSLYMALFEVGGPEGPPVPLHEGHYGGGHLRDMEEVLRLYHHFGLRYAGDFRPDHLQTELEFMHALTFAEAAGLERRDAAEVYARAEADFLRYHLRGLAQAVDQGFGGRGASFYPDLARLVAAFVEADIGALAERGP